MADNEFQMAGKRFKLSKINALKQYHLVRRISPILGEIMPTLKDMAKDKRSDSAMSEDERMDKAALMLAPLFNGMSKLTDKDSEYVLFTLLQSAEMFQEQFSTWGKISNGETLMADNLELPILIGVAGRAFMFNMSGFFAVLQQLS